MKKILSIGILLLGVITLSSCELIEQATTFEIAMITDAGDIDDKSFNQGTWEGIVEFAEANDLTHKYYKPTEVSDTAYIAAIDLAVAAGAKVVVTPGFLFESAIYTAQTKHPDVIFILIDGVPHPGDYSVFEVADNTRSILFKEQESGFLAGYAAVMEGFRELGFMGGIAVPAVVRFGLGFVAGAYYAADELGLDDFEFDMSYYDYLGTFGPSDAVKIQAAGWFGNGVEIIHVAAGGAGNSVMAAAQEATDKYVIGVDIDQAGQSPTVITSAMKALAVVVQQALQDYVDNDFVGGETLVLGAAEDAVGLPLGDSFKFDTFTLEQYNTILGKLKDGTIVLPMDTDGLNAYIDTFKVEDPIIEEPAEPIVIIDYNFGVSTAFGYGEGDLTWTQGDDTYTIAKNRVQINTSTFGARADLGAFLVFAPVQDNNYAYVELDLATLDGAAKITFDHIVWHSVNTQPAVEGLTLAEIRVELYDAVSDTWTVVDSVNLKDVISSELIATAELNILVGGLYRLSYYIEGATSTSNTTYALIVDNLKVIK